jgi:hypothetical protein
MLRLISFLDALVEMFVLVFNDAIEVDDVMFLNHAIANDWPIIRVKRYGKNLNIVI